MITDSPPLPSRISETLRVIAGLTSSTELQLTLKSLARRVLYSHEHGGTVYVFGNGGSASQADHLVGELLGRYKLERRAIMAVNLASQAGALTAIANDYGYDRYLERVLLGTHARDTAIFLSTSGKSPNVVLGATLLSMVGKLARPFLITGLPFHHSTLAEFPPALLPRIIIDSKETSVIQEATLVLIHELCGLVDSILAERS